MPEFDYTGAVKAGHSDQDIAAYLASENAKGNALTIDPTDYAQGRVWRIKNGLPAQQQAAQQAQQQAQAMNSPAAVAGGVARGVGQWGAEQLPGIGATLGVAAGAPALALGQPEVPAGLGMAGAMGGEATRQLAMRAMGLPAPQTPQQAIGRINTAGTIQGATEGLANAAARGVTGAKQAFMESALGKRALTGVDRAMVALRENVAPTRAGLQKVVAKLGDAGDLVRKLASMGDRQGYRMDARDLTNATDELHNHLVDTGEVPLHLNVGGGYVANPAHPANQLDLRDKAFIDAHESGITPSQMLTKVKEWDARAKPIYDAMNNKQTAASVTPSQRLDANWSKAMADRGREWLRSLPTIGDRIADAQDRASELIQLKNAILSPAKRQMTPGAMVAGRALPALVGAGVGAALPGSTTQRIERGAGLGLGGFMAGAGYQQAATPEALGQLALMLNHPAVAAALAHPAMVLGPAAAAQLYQAKR